MVAFSDIVEIFIALLEAEVSIKKMIMEVTITSLVH
jgi:hypothetical protein